MTTVQCPADRDPADWRQEIDAYTAERRLYSVVSEDGLLADIFGEPNALVEITLMYG